MKMIHSDSDSNSDYKPNTLDDLVIPIPIPISIYSHFDFNFDFNCESNAL